MNEREALAAVIHATRRSIPPGWTSEIADAALASDWLRDHDAALVAQARSDALREAADAWQMGEWADAPRRPDRIQERIANAQHVTDWLRARAAASSHPTGNQPTDSATRRYCEILRGTNPSPAVLRAIEAIEAELDDHPTGNQP